MATRFTAVVLMALGLAACGGQAKDAPTPGGQAGPIPEALREHVRTESFTPVTKVGDLPAGVREALALLFGETLKMADPGQPFQATDVMVTPPLPPRRLIAAGCSADHCLVHYERGGFAHVYYAVVLGTSGTTARFEWGGPSPSVLEGGVTGVRDALVSGKVTGQPASTRPW